MTSEVYGAGWVSLPRISIILKSFLLPKGMTSVPTQCLLGYLLRCTASELRSEFERGCTLIVVFSAPSEQSSNDIAGNVAMQPITSRRTVGLLA